MYNTSYRDRTRESRRSQSNGMRAWLKREWLLATLVILALAAVGYAPLFRAGEILYSPYSDIIAQHLGTKAVLFRALQEGRGIPFWRGDQFSGYPALTNPQALYTYPFHFLFFFLPPENAVGWTVWLHFLLAAASYYLVGRTLGLGLAGKLLMATSALFSFKLIMAAFAGWLPHIAGIAMFPLLFAATFYALKAPGLGAVLAVTSAGVICLHTGHLQYVYYSGLFLGVYILGRAVGWIRRHEWGTIRRASATLCLGAALALGLSAYLLLPLLGDLPLISRREADYAFFAAGQPLSARHLLTFLYPEALGTPLDKSHPGIELWETVGYFGLVQLGLALVGALAGRRGRYTPFLTMGLFFSVILAFDSPLLRVLHAVLPGFGLFRNPSRFLFLATFFGVALAGIGLNEMVALLRRRGHRSWLAPALGIAVVLAVGAEGMFNARRYLLTAPKAVVLPAPAYKDRIAQDKSVFRVAPLGATTLNYGSAPAMGLKLVTGYDSFNFSHYQSLLDLLQSGAFATTKARSWADLAGIVRPEFLDMLNVKYVLSTSPLARSDERFEEVGYWSGQNTFIFYHGMAREDIYLYRNNLCLPRAFWVTEVTEVRDASEMLSETKRQVRRESAVVLAGRRGSVSRVEGLRDHAEVREALDGYLDVHAVNEKRRFLVLSEVWHPGWKAYVNGREAPLQRANIALMGIWLPSGEHEVVLRFRPMHWTVAVAVSAACLGVLLLLAGVYCWKGDSL